MALDTRAIRIGFYDHMAYLRWSAEFSAWIGRIMAVYDADCARIESIRKRLRYGR
jgi:hypothetical protein